MTSYEFDAAIAVRETEDGLVAEVPDGWDINGNANGGYILALGANALRKACGREHPITITAHYLAPVTPGPVSFRTEVVKAGKRLTTMSGSIERDGRTLIRLLGAFGELGPADDQVLSQAAPPELPPVEQCERRTPHGGTALVGLANRLNMYIHPDDSGALHERPSGIGQTRGWFSFPDARPVDSLALLLAADAFPPAVFNMHEVVRGWVPTVEFTVHVRAIPAPGPVACRFETRVVSGGALHEDGEIWDSSGRLVALSRQYGLLARA